MSVRVVIVGVTGYVGQELCALVARHPALEIAGLFASPGAAAQPFASLHPALGGAGPDAEPLDRARLLATGAELALLATPHEASVELVPGLLAGGRRVVDLSGAYRLAEPALARQWYGIAPDGALRREAVYGLTEWCAPALPTARLVANPGCYATSILLALLPLRDLIDTAQPVVADAASGVSGAGRRKELAYSFTELHGNFKAYGLAGHRHTPEMRQALGLPAAASFTFVPHLLPAARGILATIHVAFREPVDGDTVASAYARAYPAAASPFVRLLPEGQTPELRDVVGTPRGHVGFVLTEGGRRAIVVSALDNLLKGAASQAIQNVNGMLGLHPAAGLLN